MANDTAAILPRILARALVTLRQKCIMPRVVNSDFSADAAEKGTTVDVPIPTAIGTRAVAPSNVPIVPTDTTNRFVAVPLDDWRQSDPFFLTDKDMAEIDMRAHWLPMNVDEAIKGLANYINVQIHTRAYKEIYGAVGTAGTTPFATIQSAIDVRKKLFQQVCPADGRRGIIDFNAEAAALALQPFYDAQVTLSKEVILEGEIGRKFGIDWISDDHVVQHTSTPFTAGAVTVNGAHAATPDGLSQTVSIAKATNASPLVKGDILTFAGDTQTYVVNADVVLAVGNTNVSISPGLQILKAGGEAATLTATHRVNLVFHRDCIAFAMRSLMTDQTDIKKGDLLTMQDPKTGLVLRLERSRQHKQTVWEFDVLFGVKCVRPQLGVRLLG